MIRKFSFAVVFTSFVATSGLAGREALRAQSMPSMPATATASDQGNRATDANRDVDSEAKARLRDVAYGKKSDGTFKEPSARVREAARQALSAYEKSAKNNSRPAGQNPVRAVSAEGYSSSVRILSDSPPNGQADSDRLNRAIVSPSGQLQFANFQPPVGQPPAPPTTNQPPTMPTPGPAAEVAATPGFGGLSLSSALASEVAPAGVGAPQTVSHEQVNITAPTDTAALLSQAESVQSVQIQMRSPVSSDPRIRGYKWAQIYTDADGAYWTPARLDLDTMLSKIDPGMIDNVTILPGPYGLRYGPGFAFIDVERLATPRHADGYKTEYDTTANVRANGGQFYGRETISGGGSDWGFRVSYGDRQGLDYTAGNGQTIPSTYHNRDEWGQVGYDINPNQHLEIAFQNLDQTNTDYPCEFFDLSYLRTYGFQARIVDDDPKAPWNKLSVEGWYNHTNFAGDTSNKNNPNFPVMQRVEFATDSQFGLTGAPGYNPLNPASSVFGTTQGDQFSSGGRAGVVVGDKDSTQFRTGADFRYLGQRIGENFNVVVPTVTTFDFNTNMPHAWSADPGVFAEISLPVSQAWTVSVGARVDYVEDNARASDLRPGPLGYGGSLPGINADLTGTSELHQEHTIYSLYLTNKLKVGEHWTLTGGFGEAQRPATLTERYADGLFISVLQSGFTHIIGDPQLNEEQDWQIDVGLAADYDDRRFRINAFHAWIPNYITLAGEAVSNPIAFPDARLVNFINTGMATLVGFDMVGEQDLGSQWGVFGKMSYVDGRDLDIGAPLPGMSPIEATLGGRLHDADHGKRWGTEAAVRIVGTQFRLGSIHAIALDANNRPLPTGTAVVAEERTPAFATCNLRGYYNYTKNLSLSAGIDNVFNTNYQEHLDLRLLGPAGFGPATRVLAPGITPYFGLNWIF